MKIQVFKISIEEGQVQRDQKKLDDFLEQHNVLKFESAFVQGKEYFWSVILYYEPFEVEQKQKPQPKVKTAKFAASNDDVFNPDEIKILDALKIWRSEKAKEQSLPSYFIASNNELMSVAKFRPAKKEELIEIKGFGKHKIENYGSEIIEIVEGI